MKIITIICKLPVGLNGYIDGANCTGDTYEKDGEQISDEVPTGRGKAL